jgi:seryl-tRNA synthetase
LTLFRKVSVAYNEQHMLDIHFIRENADLVKSAAAKKNVEVDIDRLLQVDDERKALRQEIDAKRAEQNRMNETIRIARNEDREAFIQKMRHLKEGLTDVEESFDKATEEWTKLMLAIPNIPSPDTPEGPDESGNKVVRQWGSKPDFSFAPKAHWDLGKDLGVINMEKAAEVSGSRFAYLMGDLVLLQFALIDLVFKTLTSKETLAEIARQFNVDVDTKPFIPVVPPVLMRTNVMGKMARLQPIDERYYFEKDDLVFVGSAEHTLGPLHMDEIIAEAELPIRYIGYSTAFRREAGAAGKDTRGILRLHQFDKLEMESFVRSEDGYREQEFFVAIQEYLMQKLNLPYEVMAICTGDMGKPDHRQFDINTWMPGQGVYRETHTADYMGGYQARRLNTRYRTESGDITHVHMNDATLFAIGRTLIAIMENYQLEDGTIQVPEILVPYVGKEIVGHTA